MNESERVDFGLLHRAVTNNVALSPADRARYDSYLSILDSADERVNSGIAHQLQERFERLQRMEAENARLRAECDALFHQLFPTAQAA